MYNKSPQTKKGIAHQSARIALVAALYVVITLVTAPISFGIGLRVAEGLNFLVLYDKRHIYGLTLGVFLVNYLSYGIWDMIVGSLSTFIFLLLASWIAEILTKQLPETWKRTNKVMIFKYVILTILFSLSMFTIALLVVFLNATESFLPLYIYFVWIELLSMFIGGLIIYPISKRIKFN